MPNCKSRMSHIFTSSRQGLKAVSYLKQRLQNRSIRDLLRALQLQDKVDLIRPRCYQIVGWRKFSKCMWVRDLLKKGRTQFFESIESVHDSRCDAEPIISHPVDCFLLVMSRLMHIPGPQVAKNASAAAEGLCTWVRAMKFYHEASKIVKPKLEALAIAEGQMDAANKVSNIR